MSTLSLDDRISQKNLQSYQYNSGKIYTLNKQQVKKFSAKYSYIEYTCQLHDGKNLIKSISVCHYFDGSNEQECADVIIKSILDCFPELMV